MILIKKILVGTLLVVLTFCIFVFFQERRKCNLMSEKLARLSISQLKLRSLIEKKDFKKIEAECAQNIHEVAIYVLSNDLENPNMKSFVDFLVNNRKELKNSVFTEEEWELLVSYCQ